jgi:co-chaperonin GroES (HSP10)
VSERGFTVTDRRGRGEEEIHDPRGVAPASLIEDDDAVVRVTPETCFIHPTAGRVVVQADKIMNKVGRIIIPGKTQKRPTTGVILKIGKGVEDFEVGDRIAYGLYSGTVLTFKGWDPKTRINFHVLSVEEILAKVDSESPELEGVGV